MFGLSAAGLAGRVPLILGVLVVLAVCAYGLFVQDQLHQIHEFNLRELGHAADAVEVSVQASLDRFKNWKSAKAVCELAKTTAYLKFSETDCDCLDDRKLAPGQWEGGTLNYEWGTGAMEPRCAGAGESKPHLDVQFEKILNGLAFPDSFTTTFLADDKGNILYQHNRRHYRSLRHPGRLDELVDMAASGAGEASNPGATRRIGDLRGIAEASGKKVPLEQFSSGTSQARIEVAGSSVYLYVQPVTLKTRMYVGGMVSADEALRNAFAVDSYLLIFLVLTVTLILLGRPFVRLALLSPHERFRTFDAYEFIFSAVALVVLAVVVIASLDAYLRQRDREDVEMKALAGRIEDNLAKEVRAARRQLATLDRAAGGKFPVEGYTPIPNLGLDGRLPTTLSYWPRQAAWIRPNGCQFLKTAPESSLTPQTDVSQRPYFLAIANGGTWELGPGEPFMLHPALSVTDGQFYSFVSIPSAIAPPSGGWASLDPARNCNLSGPIPAGPVVAAMTLDLRSATDQPLPAGYGFAIVNREGHTLYQNDPGRLREDFIQEVAQPLRLAAILDGDAEGLKTLTYQARPHRFLVRPLTVFRWHGGSRGELSWFLIVHRDLAGTQAITVRISVLALIWAMTGMIAIGIAAILAMCYASRKLFQGRGGAWLWPHAGRTRSYRWLAGWGSVVLAAELACLALLDGSWLLAVALGFPALIATLWVASLWRDRHDRKALGIEERSPLPGLALPFILATVTFVAGFAVPLAGGFFKLFWNDEAGRIRYATQLDQREARAGLLARDRDRQCQEIPALCKQRAASQAAFVLETADPGTGHPRPWAAPLADLLPIQNAVAARALDSPAVPIEPGTPGGGGFSAWALLFVPIFGLIPLWAWTYGVQMLHGKAEPAQPAAAVELGFDRWWSSLGNEQQGLMLQVSAESMANPKASGVVRELLAAGALVLDPDLRPASWLAEPLRARLTADSAALAAWEKQGATGWRSMRWLVWFALIAITMFIVATQPELPAELSAVASVTIAVVANIRKMIDAFEVRV